MKTFRGGEHRQTIDESTLALAPKASVAAAISISALACFAAPNAEAIQVIVGGSSYDVTTFAGSASSNTSKFNITNMPWLGDQSLATSFATAVGASLGIPNAAGNHGPYFAYATPATVHAMYFFNPSSSVFSKLDLNTFVSVTWATATLIPPSPPSTSAVPGPLPLFGAAAAFGWSRRLRSRLGAGRNWELN